jgi:hypothetical protein
MPVWAVLGALLVLLAGLASLGTWLCIWRVID